jgi:hypothetical protein
MKNRDGHDPPWYDSAWSRRRTITANRNKVIGSEDLINIPLLYDHETDDGLPAADGVATKRSPRSVPPLEFGPSAGRTLEMTITWAGTVAEAVRT